jgi:hypothetical protein
MISEIKSITGGLGTELITSSVANKKYSFLVINSDTVFDTLTGSNTTDIKVDLNLGSTPIRQGMIIRPKNGELIKDVTLTSGSVFGIITG